MSFLNVFEFLIRESSGAVLPLATTPISFGDQTFHYLCFNSSRWGQEAGVFSGSYLS